jgi:hypothetical protein
MRCGMRCSTPERGASANTSGARGTRTGTGTVLGGEGTHPTIGERGREERVPELRLETVYPAEREEDVVRALRAAHPYEEPAFDLYALL